MSGADYEALGLIRTNELLRADRYYGVDQRWGTVADYGFSKTMDEALSQWGRERVLYDAVRAVRLYRPLVVSSVFVGGVTDGHGHHQVAGMLAQLVYKAAADPKMFPDQIAAGLAPWAPLRVYERVPTFSLSPKGMYDYATGKWAPVRFRDYVNDTWIDGAPSTDVEIPEGTLNPLLGQTDFQIARHGLGEQRTQHEGPNVPLPGDVASPYHCYGSRVGKPGGDGARPQSFFAGIDNLAAGHDDTGARRCGISEGSTRPTAATGGRCDTKLSARVATEDRAAAGRGHAADDGPVAAGGREPAKRCRQIQPAPRARGEAGAVQRRAGRGAGRADGRSGAANERRPRLRSLRSGRREDAAADARALAKRGNSRRGGAGAGACIRTSAGAQTGEDGRRFPQWTGGRALDDRAASVAGCACTAKRRAAAATRCSR